MSSIALTAHGYQTVQTGPGVAIRLARGLSHEDFGTVKAGDVVHVVKCSRRLAWFRDSDSNVWTCIHANLVGSPTI